MLETLHLKAAYCTRYAEQFVSGDVGSGAYRCFFTLADPDGWVWRVAIRPAAREHGTLPVLTLDATPTRAALPLL